MAGDIRALLDISRRALSTQSQALRVIGNNISNVNTPGYTRRRTEMVPIAAAGAEGGAAGAGTEVETIRRIADRFVNSEYLRRIGEYSEAEITDSMLSRAEGAFSIDGETDAINSRLVSFFAALEDLSTDPASVSLRQQVIEEGDGLARVVRGTMENIAGLQREADGQIEIRLNDVNRLTAEVADLNDQIRTSETTDQENNTLRDMRDQRLRDLSELISFQSVEDNDGMVSVSLSNGFTLVSGSTSRSLSFDRSPSFAPPGGFPPGMDGQNLGHIVFPYSGSDANLTSVIANGDGAIAGLLRVRGVQSTTDTTPYSASGSLVEIGSRVEAIAQDLLTRFNLAYRGPDRTGGGAGHQPTSIDLTGGSPGVYGLFSATGAADTVTVDGIPNDLSNIVSTGGKASYAMTLTFGISDPRKIAAALDTTTLPPASLVLSQGDGRNIQNILSLRSQNTTYNVGSFNSNTTIEHAYELAVTHVGGLASAAGADLANATDRRDQMRELQTSISGVSLDDEFSQLVNYQRAFEAAARLVKVGDELMQQVLGLLG